MRLPRANILLLLKMIFEIVDRKQISVNCTYTWKEKCASQKLNSKPKELATFIRNSPELY